MYKLFAFEFQKRTETEKDLGVEMLLRLETRYEKRVFEKHQQNLAPLSTAEGRKTKFSMLKDKLSTLAGLGLTWELGLGLRLWWEGSWVGDYLMILTFGVDIESTAFPK